MKEQDLQRKRSAPGSHDDASLEPSIADSDLRRERRFPRAVVIAGLLVMATHVVMTLIYLNPLSVVGLELRGPVMSYMEPLFRQRWSLFAPDPPMIDRRLDYQCDSSGEHGPWVSRSDELLDTFARVRFSPAGGLRRLETAAIVATVGSADGVITQLISSQDDATDEQRERVEDMLAQRVAASIRSSETAYRLVRSYCEQDLGREADRIRYRIVHQYIAPFSIRNEPDKREEPKGLVLPWLRPGEFGELDARADAFLRTYEEQKLKKKQDLQEGQPADSPPTADPVVASPAQGDR